MKYYKTGQKVKTEFKGSFKTTKIQYCDKRKDRADIIIALTEYELYKFMAHSKARKKICKKFKSYFIHLSPDISFFIRKGKSK